MKRQKVRKLRNCGNTDLLKLFLSMHSANIGEKNTLDSILNQLIKNKINLEEILLLENKKITTINNHIIPASYYGKWGNNPAKRKRYNEVFISDKETNLFKKEKVEKIAIKKYLFTQDMEEILTRIIYLPHNKPSNSEEVTFLENIDKAVSNEAIDSLGYYEFIYLENNNKYAAQEIFIPPQTITKKTSQQYKKDLLQKISIKNSNVPLADLLLFFTFIKSRSYFYYLIYKNLNNFECVKNILIKILQNPKKFKLTIKSMIKIIAIIQTFKRGCTIGNNKIMGVQDVEWINDLNKLENSKKIKNFLITFKNKLNKLSRKNNNNIINSLFCSKFFNSFLLDISTHFNEIDRKKSYLILILNNKISTREIPCVFDYLKQEDIIMLEKLSNIKNQNNIKCPQEVIFLPYSPNILIIQSEYFILNMFKEIYKKNPNNFSVFFQNIIKIASQENNIRLII